MMTRSVPIPMYMAQALPRGLEALVREVADILDADPTLSSLVLALLGSSLRG